MNLAQRIQQNPMLLLGLGVALILAALALIWLNLSARNEASRVAATPVAGERDSGAIAEVVVAARDILRGESISAEDLTLRRMEVPAPSGSFTNSAGLIGRVATSDISTSQIVFSNSLSKEPSDAGLAALVPEGQRAFSLRVAEEDIVGGFLQAGDRVDVFATFPGAVYGQQAGIGQSGEDRSKSALLLQDMQVLAVGATLSTKGREVNAGARTVTVAAPPAALAKLALAGRLGHITLAIRNPADKDLASAEMVALEDLQPGASSVDPKREPETSNVSGHRITIYSGANQTIVTAPR